MIIRTAGISFSLIFFFLSSYASAKEVTVPINIGFGPSAYFITGDLQNDQAPHFGLKLDLAAVLNKKTIRDNKDKVPKKYRNIVNKVGEARVSHILVPDALIISPKTQNTGMYGITWKPLGINQPLLNAWLKFKVGAGLLFTYAYIDRDYTDSSGAQVNQVTHFARPGIDLRAHLELPFSESFLMSFGWSSAFYVPQRLGTFIGVGTGSDILWHFGHAYALLNIRIPHTGNI